MAEVRLIGGHLGFDVYREGGVIRKVAQKRDGEDRYLANVQAICNEARFLRVMADSGFTPALLAEGEDSIVQTDLGTTEPMKDGEAFRRNCIKLLWTLRRRGVRHGDMTGPGNVMCINDWPWVVDWQEAHLIGDPAPQKQPFSDSHLLWRTVAGTVSSITKSYDVPRIARRWLAVIGKLGATFHLGLPLQGKTFLDLGCFQGDFPAMAATERMAAMGVDQGGFRTGENSIDIACHLWAYMRDASWPYRSVMFRPDNIVRFVETGGVAHEVVMMFSTWSYIVKDYGLDKACEILGRTISDAGVFFFENQLYGDGPGPDVFKTDDDIAALLGRWGDVDHLIRIPVWGRPAERSVFVVRHKES